MANRENLKPGYFNSKPLLRPIKRMKLTAGVQDSCLQTNEVAIMYLEEKAIESGNIDEFIDELCKKYSISKGITDLGHFKSTLYNSYILQTYNLIEPFFKKINIIYKNYNNFKTNWKVQDGEGKNLDPFNQLLFNMPPEKANIIKSYPEYYLLNYYRLVRNSVVHLQESEDRYSKIHEYYTDNLRDKQLFFLENYEMDAPNPPDKIAFKDFVLYTRALKYFSNIINDVCFPSIDNLVEFAQSDVALQSKLRQTNGLKYNGALLGRINALRGFFHGHFNHVHKELRDEFCKAYLDKEQIDSSKYL